MRPEAQVSGESAHSSAFDNFGNFECKNRTDFYIQKR